jgi:hypothetical protein
MAEFDALRSEQELRRHLADSLAYKPDVGCNEKQYHFKGEAASADS